MKRNYKSIFPNHFRLKSLGNLSIRQIPVQTVGLRKFYQLFGGETEKIIEEINKELAA